MDYHTNLQDLQNALSFIPADDYNVYRDVMAALKHEALVGKILEDDAIALARSWASTSSKFDSREFEKKWASFRDTYSGDLIKAGSIIQMAKNYGYRAVQRDIAKIGIGSRVNIGDLDTPQNSQSMSVLQNAAPLSAYEQEKQIMQFLDLYQDTDRLNIVISATYLEKNKKWIPEGKGITRTVSEWKESIHASFMKKAGPFSMYYADTDKNGCDVSYNPDAGVWVRINPTDGRGVGNGNITSFRYALVESDSMDKVQQLQLIKKIGCTVLAIDSGKKSIHAVIDLNAASLRDYAQKIEILYEHCEKLGLKVDRNTRNPSRLMRLPGVQRGQNWQRIVWTPPADAVMDFSTWVVSMQLGAPIDIADDWDTFDPAKDLAPELVHGVLRQGHKMIITGPSKSGKSMAMLELAVAIARGDYWLMHKCSRGRVLFINFEIDPASFKKRVHAYCLKRGIRLDPGMMEIWNLRGHLIEPKSFAENLIRYCRGKQFSAILLDPIYKMMEMQDENNAADISQMCNLFDKITMETDASIIFSHHFSKGSKYNTSAIDRASGSGVFARDPDAIVVFSLLDWKPPEETPYKTAIRVEMILREFASPQPMNFFFDYPLHEYDEENILMDTELQGSPATKKKEGGKTRGDQQSKERDARILDLKNLLHATLDLAGGRCDMVGGKRAIALALVSSKLGCAPRTIQRYIQEMPGYYIKQNYIFPL